MKEKLEQRCCSRFLEWYKQTYKKSCGYIRAEECFPELKGKLRWEFVVYERNRPQDWDGIEIKELPSLIELDIGLNYWRSICADLKKLIRNRITGMFMIMLPPALNFKQKDRRNLAVSLADILHKKKSDMVLNEPVDIGPDLAIRINNWPVEKSDIDDYDRFGEWRPSELSIMKISESGCEIESSSSFYHGNVVERHKEALDQIFKPLKAKEQLGLAKKYGARSTILLLACKSFDDEELIKQYIHRLNQKHFSNTDYIYLVDTGDQRRVVSLFPI